MSRDEKSLQAVESSNDASLTEKSRQGSRLSLAEQTTIRTLRAQGQSATDIARVMNRNPQTIRRYLADCARDILSGNLEEYANMHLEGARVAAAKGDTRPAEWAMERARVVESKPQPTENKGFTVQIGVLLPNLGQSSALVSTAGVNAQTVDGEVDSD